MVKPPALPPSTQLSLEENCLRKAYLFGGTYRTPSWRGVSQYKQSWFQKPNSRPSICLPAKACQSSASNPQLFWVVAMEGPTLVSFPSVLWVVTRNRHHPVAVYRSVLALVHGLLPRGSESHQTAEWQSAGVWLLHMPLSQDQTHASGSNLCC